MNVPDTVAAPVRAWCRVRQHRVVAPPGHTRVHQHLTAAAGGPARRLLTRQMHPENIQIRGPRACILLGLLGVRHLVLFSLANGLDGRGMSRLTGCSAGFVAAYLTSYDSEPLVGRGELRGSTCQPIALLS